MTKPSDFSPAKALEVKSNAETKPPRRSRWLLRIVGAGVLLLGWLVVSLNDIGQVIFIVDTIVFLAIGFFAFAAVAASRKSAVNEERTLRLRLLVHNMELENLSMRDELTQLFNRRYLFDRMERELNTAKGFQRPLAFVAIKIRSLQHVNDVHGYAVGDKLLAAFGQLLLDRSRATDIPARMSGDKFGVILSDTSKRGAYAMIERLTESLAATPLIEDLEQKDAGMLSFGVSGYPWGNDTVDDIIGQAERELADQAAAPDASEPSPDCEPAPAVDIPNVFRHNGKKVSRPEIAQS